MAEESPVAENRLDMVPRRTDLVPRRLRDQLIKSLSYRRYGLKPDPDWTSYAAQRHVREIAFDREQNRMWLATWGGVLCLSLDARLCIRHTSEHGLVGNAIRCIAVDDNRIVWAGCQHGGLCSLLPEENSSWRVHDDLNSWTVLCMAPRPGGGVYVALRDGEGRCALRRVIGPQDKRPMLLRRGLAVKEIEAMLVDKEGTLWMGNLWGLHCYRDDSTTDSFELDRAEICALATGTGGSLWVGTNRGVYRFRADAQPHYQQEPDWPRDQIVSLAEESVSGNLWVATTREVGRIINNVWQPVLKSPPDRLNILRIASADVEASPPSVVGISRAGRAWVGGANGLYDVGLDEYEAALPPNQEDALSNAVQCLWTTDSTVWAGTARGLASYDGQSWANYAAGDSQLRDVRAIVGGENGGVLMIGTGRKGLYRLEAGLCSPDQSLALPLVSLSAGADGNLWAATGEAIYWRPAGSQLLPLRDDPPAQRGTAAVASTATGLPPSNPPPHVHL